MAAPTIRTARPAEASAVLALWREAGSGPGATDSEDSLEQLLDASPDGLLVAELEGALVGTLIAAWDGWRGNLYRLAVRPSHRRRGIARALLEEGERRLRGKGGGRVSGPAIQAAGAPGGWAAPGSSRRAR